MPRPPLVQSPSLSVLRRELRARRRALSTGEQRRHASALCRVLRRAPRLWRARRIGAYWPADGELDPRPLLARLRALGARIFLPVLRPGRQRRLWFVPYPRGARLQANRLGIPEPRHGRRQLQLPRSLDLLLVPLVGFDADGNRIGMGGGYYDRTLAYLRQRTRWRRPRLIGIAHACQRVERIAPRDWDIPLDGVATELGIYRRRWLVASG